MIYCQIYISYLFSPWLNEKKIEEESVLRNYFLTLSSAKQLFVPEDFVIIIFYSIIIRSIIYSMT